VRANGLTIRLSDVPADGRRWEPELMKLAFPFEVGSAGVSPAGMMPALPREAGGADLRDAFRDAYKPRADAREGGVPRELARMRAVELLSAQANCRRGNQARGGSLMPRSFMINQAHLEAFSKPQTKRFADEMVAYFKQYYPKESAELGEDGLRELIDEGVEKAKSYDTYREVDVARYIQFMVAIRRDFDTSDQTPWAGPILTNDTLLAPDKLEQVTACWTGGPKE
jgi:hypothetical protein